MSRPYTSYVSFIDFLVAETKNMLLNRIEIVLLLAILTFVVGFEVQENIISVRSSFQMEQQETTDGLIRARSATSTGN